MAAIVDLIDQVLMDSENEETLERVAGEVNEMMEKRPLFVW
jgi:glycine/serine hydroxymethyltransferase